MSVSDSDFRAVLGRFASGVTVVTTMREGTPHGVTVNAFTSLSLNPPLVLICIDTHARIHDILLQTGLFAANILSAEQRDLAACFATRNERRYRDFCDAPYHTAATGAPVFDAALGWVDCRIVNVYPGGDHSVIIGQVEALGGAEQAPLLYYRGKYRRLDPAAPALPSTLPTAPDVAAPTHTKTSPRAKAAHNGANAPDEVGADARHS